MRRLTIRDVREHCPGADELGSAEERDAALDVADTRAPGASVAERSAIAAAILQSAEERSSIVSQRRAEIAARPGVVEVTVAPGFTLAMPERLDPRRPDELIARVRQAESELHEIAHSNDRLQDDLAEERARAESATAQLLQALSKVQLMEGAVDAAQALVAGAEAAFVKVSSELEQLTVKLTEDEAEIAWLRAQLAAHAATPPAAAPAPAQEAPAASPAPSPAPKSEAAPQGRKKPNP